jgi:hypothetical protein
MDQLTPSLSLLVAIDAGCFRAEVFAVFRVMLGGWICCLGRRTISRVWETTGLSQTQDHSAAFRLFSQAVWNWDEVCRLLLLDLVAHLVPGTEVWLVVDDTLCHKRGGHVAFGGIFLDAVLSTAKHKVFRYGNNWVTLGVVVSLPFRPDRYYCLNVLWRVSAKRGAKTKAEHRTKPQLAAEMVHLIARWLPGRKLRVVGDVAYVGQPLLKDRPSNVDIVGPIHWKAALSEPLSSPPPPRRKQGARLPSPQVMLPAHDPRWPVEKLRLVYPGGEKELEVKVVRDVCWYPAAGPRPLLLVLVRDPAGQWRDEALLSTDLTLTAEQVIAGYCRRWSVEVAYADSKGFLGLHDPEVWCANSVERAHPMSWYVGSLVILWYTLFGRDEPTPQRHRPWYTQKPEITFADMLATCRYHLWQHWLAKSASRAEWEQRSAWLLEYLATAA